MGIGANVLPASIKADLRISVKDYRRDRNLKIQLLGVPFSSHQFFVRMHGQPWPKNGKPVSMTRLMTAVRLLPPHAQDDILRGDLRDRRLFE